MYNRQQIKAIGLYTRSTLDNPLPNFFNHDFWFHQKSSSVMTPIKVTI